MFWKTKKFRELQEKWYSKLEESGFKDIERHPDALHTETAKFADRELYQVFYSRVNEYLQSGEFDSLFDKVVWFLYCDGYSNRVIAKVLSQSKTRIGRVTNKYLKRMKLQESL